MPIVQTSNRRKGFCLKKSPPQLHPSSSPSRTSYQQLFLCKAISYRVYLLVAKSVVWTYQNHQKSLLKQVVGLYSQNFLKIFFIILCVCHSPDLLHVCMCAQFVHAVSVDVREGFRAPWTRIIACCEPSYGSGDQAWVL